MHNKLKPCPFCGKAPMVYVSEKTSKVFCGNENCQINPATIYYADIVYLYEIWNERDVKP